MKRLMMAMMVSVCGAVLLGDEVGNEAGLLKARIVQLEAQLVQTEASRAVCEARFNQAQSVQVRPAIEKETGCVIDWNAVPPKCKE